MNLLFSKKKRKKERKVENNWDIILLYRDLLTTFAMTTIPWQWRIQGGGGGEGHAPPPKTFKIC